MGGTGSGHEAASLRGFVPALTTFVGRAEEIDKVCALLDRYRLVTVTGPGGVGKTRLAAEVARRLAGRFADGIRLSAIGVIAILASANALAHSYAGLYDWAVHHRLTGWQAMSWPAEIDVFLAVGELALYVAYLDGWPARQRIWPWTTALTGLAVSIAGNIGHIQPGPGHPVILADRLTAATSPVAAFAGLTVGLLVLKMTRQLRSAHVQEPRVATALVLAPPQQATDRTARSQADSGLPAHPGSAGDMTGHPGGMGTRAGLLRDASAIYQDAAARGERVSQRTLARQLRGHGHRFPNEHLRWIADSIGLTANSAA